MQNFRRNLGVSLAGVCTMGLILVLIGALALGTHLLTNVLHDQESRASKLKIYIQDGVSLADIVNFQHRLKSDARVLAVTFENKDQAFQEAASKGTDIATAVTALGSNPLPASLNVDVRQLRYLVQLDHVARTDPIVDSTQPTDYNPDVTPKIQAAINIIEGVVGFVSLMLLVVSLVIIMNTIRTAVYARRTEIEIMKLVGATKWFIRGPFIFEAALYGIIAAVIATLLSMLLLFGGATRVATYIDFSTTLNFFQTYIFVIIAAEFALGVTIGAVSSLLAMSRYLKL